MIGNLEFKKSSKWSETNNKILKLYRDNFSKIDPDSLKVIEFGSSKKIEKSVSPSRTSTSPLNTSILHDLTKNHISLNSATKIVKLPMSPFGKHHNYNEEHNFLKSHFLDTNSEESKQIDKKIKTLKKRISIGIRTKANSKGFFKDKQSMAVYKSKAGELYCKIDKPRFSRGLEEKPTWKESSDDLFASINRKICQSLTPTKLLSKDFKLR